jgi:DNA-3-methyladenine glycosylase II
LNFTSLCDELGSTDKDLGQIITRYGYPPMWSRNASFETLVHIILEQQVSLASAKAALLKLKEKLGYITPAKLVGLTDVELRACYFSRQKIVYARALAENILGRRFSPGGLSRLSDEEARSAMKANKGIGDWTADVFMMMALRRTDCFPIGDIALVKSIRQVKKLPADLPKEKILAIADKWQPNRTIAAYLLWHDYLSRRRT